MIDFLIVLLVFLWGSTLMSALILVRHRQHPACRQFAWAVENDSDIKIAPDFSSKSSLPRLEPSEEEILLYFKHKQCCNLEKARCLLSDMHYSISEVSYLSGYADAKYFAKLFKKRMGSTPTEYRNLIIQGGINGN